MNRLLMLVGAVQGLGLWAIWKARSLSSWPATDPVSERGLLYMLLAVPLAYYLLQSVQGLTLKRRNTILVLFGLLFALLGAYSGWAENIFFDPKSGIWHVSPLRPSDTLAAAILGFVLVPLLATWQTGGKHWSYHSLFEVAWRNAMLCLSSAVMTGLFWMVLFAGAMLMKSIGINIIYRVIEKPIFFMPVSGMVFGTAFALGLVRVEMIVTLRRYVLTISAWLLPLLLAFSAMWVVALPFTGLQSLFNTRQAAFVLMWFLALSVNFANAAYQDGNHEHPYGRWLDKVLEYLWPTLLVLVVVAWSAMQQRIAQHGWTEDRVWGIFVMLLLTLYVAGYAWSLRYRQGWLYFIGKTNIATALVMCAGMIMLLSPLADARRIAVNSQMTRLQQGEIPAEKVDYSYLRWEAGRYGQQALQQLAAGIEHADKKVIAAKAAQVLAQKQRYADDTGIKELSIDQVRHTMRVIPQNEKLPQGVVQLMQKGSDHWQEKRCLQAESTCVAWLVDLNDDGLQEVVLIVTRPEWSLGEAVFYHQFAKNNFKYGGTLNLGAGLPGNRKDKLLQEIESGNVKIIKPRFNDIEIDGKRVSVMAPS